MRQVNLCVETINHSCWGVKELIYDMAIIRGGGYNKDDTIT